MNDPEPGGDEPRPDETPEKKFKRLGIVLDESSGTTIIFLGPKGAAAIKKQLGQYPDYEGEEESS